MFITAVGALYIKGLNGDFLELGNVKAAILTCSDGQMIRMGKPEDVFDIELSEEDNNLLSQLKISKG
jgi:hypothetical protein